MGDALSTDDPDLFVTSDGGYTWNRALKGPHKTLIGDSGAVTWAVEQDETIDTLKFRFDLGLLILGFANWGLLIFGFQLTIT